MIIVAGAFGAAAVWFFFFRSAAPTDRATIPAKPVASSNPDVQRIKQELADLRRLKELQLDTSILKNPFLQSLEPLRIPPPVGGQPGATTTPTLTTPGRSNPFVPF